MIHQPLPNGATLIQLDDGERDDCALVHATNFSVQWIGEADRAITFASGQETIVILATGTSRIEGDSWVAAMTAPSVAIVPSGVHRLIVEDGTALVLATEREDLSGAAADRHDRVSPIGAPFVRRVPLTRAEVIRVADLIPPPANGRLRFLQSATMSINFVIYDGPRGAGALSPHAHADIEQGTLALHGDYVHHLRTPWGADAAEWRDDMHVPVGPGTLLLIPPELIHTTEGVGSGQHMLVDIFAPPRRDFIARGWMANAADYRDPLA